MDWNKLFGTDDEKPLDRFVTGISNTAIFRKIAFIGDSLSSGEFESRNSEGKHGYNDYFEYSWGQFIARKNGLTAYNFSRGGMTAKEYVDSYADKMRFWDPCNTAQAYVIALGVNDIINKGMDIGDISHIGRPETDSFAYYYTHIIERIKKLQPRAKFFFVTMPRSGGEKDILRKAHADFLYSLCEHYDNCYVIDLFQYAPVYDDSFKKRFYLYGHMNPSGYVLTANMIDSYIDYIIRHNPEEFYRVGYIGTELN